MPGREQLHEASRNGQCNNRLEWLMPTMGEGGGQPTFWDGPQGSVGHLAGLMLPEGLSVRNKVADGRPRSRDIGTVFGCR